VSNLNVFNTPVEKRMVDISNGYQTATNQAAWDQVILGVTGKTNFADLVRTGTPQDWRDVYSTLKRRSFLK